MVFRAELMFKPSAAVWPGRMLFFSSGFAYAVWGVGVAVVDHTFALSTSALSLALFTFLATMIYYMPVNKYYYQFFSNTTTFGCMLLLAYFISKKC
jgi:hypothetical protein